MSTTIQLQGPVPFDPARHDTAAFDRGDEAQTRWLRRVAATAQAAGTARVYVVTLAGSPRVAGYHALAAASVRQEDVPEALRAQAGRSPIPAILLARLGVDVTMQGRGAGAALVKDAMVRAHRASGVVGARALLVHAASPAARAFYLAVAEFQSSPTDPFHLVIPMRAIAAALEP